MDRVHGDVADASRSAAGEEVYELVRRVPRGWVVTYGQLASLLGSRVSPRAVGWMLHRCPKDVPWHRVVNASGRCSTDRLPDVPTGLQRAILEGEGIVFDAGGAIDLDRFRWTP